MALCRLWQWLLHLQRIIQSGLLGNTTCPEALLLVQFMAWPPPFLTTSQLRPVFKKVRKCPYCDHGQLTVGELAHGTNCSSCHRFVEMDFRFSAGIPAVLAFCVFLCLVYGAKELGLLLKSILVVFTSGYKSLFTGYLPLRHYGGT